MSFFERLQKGLILFDGAMGTQIHALQITEEEWAAHHGCPEILNLTAPQKIQRIHEAYLAAGADVIETNTFGANRIVLTEFDLQDRVEEINRAAAEIARQAADRFSDSKPRFVAGSIGPGTKLPSLGQVDFDTLYESYAAQARGLIQGGVDLFVIETCQDLLQIKAALTAVQDEMQRAGVHLPRAVTITVETTGTMLVGSDVSAALAALAPYELEIFGMNCATGPEAMRPFVKQICEAFPGVVMVQPNAGMPQMVDGHLVYTLSIEEYVTVLSSFIQEYGVKIVGGCCGTTPDFIRAMAERLPYLAAAERQPIFRPALASLFTAQEIRQDPPPFFVGERSNTNGSKQFRERLLAEDWDAIVEISREQERTGAHGLDLCVAYTGRDEVADMTRAVSRIVTQVNLPIFIDSTDVKVIEAALKLIGGRPVINSINLEDDEERAHRICRLAKRYGAALVSLTIDESGMAKTVEQKIAVAKRLYDIAVRQNGLRPYDLIFDPLTFTLGSGDETLRDAAIQTLEGIRRIKQELPGVFTLLGVSNISFGLNPESREVLNSVFLAEAVKAGLDAAIVNVKKIIPLYQIDAEDIRICLDLIYNRGETPLLDFIRHFEKRNGRGEEAAAEEPLSLEEKVKQHIIQGNRSGLEELLKAALAEHRAVDIINRWLIPAMKTVGDLFGAGKMQLPFVLQSAEAMKHAVGILEPFMEKSDVQTRTSLVLATVRGDVHDIGKNLVDIILSNNGFKVYNLGIKCEIDTMLQKADEVGADAIGMSGLLVKSTVVMKENLEVMRQRGYKIPVLLGGAALTRSYVDQVCSPILDAPVVYCEDAFEGLKVMNLLKEGKLSSLFGGGNKKEKRSESKPLMQEAEPLRFDHDIPVPPFWGSRVIEDIDLKTVFSFLTEPVLFRGRWGYRRGTLSREEYDRLIEEQVRPQFELLKEKCIAEKLLEPKVVYGYFPCNRQGDDVIIFDPKTDTEVLRFHFPRQKKPPYRSIADFFLPLESGRHDIMPMQIATVGSRASEYAQRLYENNAYKDYLLFHGLSVESAEALAEYWHKQIRLELNIAAEDGTTMEELVVQKYRGSRYSFGYPACPDLYGNRQIAQLLSPERIGVQLTEEDQMIPEQTTSAFIVHHPQAKYFSLE
ncbi:MAG: methionine synthase [candidate division KSB1 bacterium]|nr:methionine synthase [candidate division KSB1 bacterium]